MKPSSHVTSYYVKAGAFTAIIIVHLKSAKLLEIIKQPYFQEEQERLYRFYEKPRNGTLKSKTEFTLARLHN